MSNLDLFYVMMMMVNLKLKVPDRHNSRNRMTQFAIRGSICDSKLNRNSICVYYIDSKTEQLDYVIKYTSIWHRLNASLRYENNISESSVCSVDKCMSREKRRHNSKNYYCADGPDNSLRQWLNTYQQMIKLVLENSCRQAR